jgi:hypothetical protein
MRTLILATLFSITLTAASAAQSCGGAMQPGQTAQAGGMSCMGGQTQQTQATDTFGRPVAKPAAMMCACCRNMASMGGMKHDDNQKHDEMTPEKKE